ncbi:hypothetical protein BZA05DRAFT_222939 [Tricharina praecox]|uniref:uncharacterized protein n=1 Tax=Tricharina praecox TaxID=43433 RepID=UPI00221ED292|nr:uncharacterized protein BZA05DRAFT_222939 [Tricharina praecox]KAI5855972.1 hypothetical protein BZA05DRAFT_222939 [Tricharina praecox]
MQNIYIGLCMCVVIQVGGSADVRRAIISYPVTGGIYRAMEPILLGWVGEEGGGRGGRQGDVVSVASGQPLHCAPRSLAVLSAPHRCK